MSFLNFVKSLRASVLRTRASSASSQRAIRRRSFLEQLEDRSLMANDTFATAFVLGNVTTTPSSSSSSITPDTDVDIYRFSVTAGQVVDFNINTTLNGPGGLGSYIRLFNSSGTELAFNNDANAPGENVVGYDAYLRYTFASAGTYYLGVSNYTNIAYNPVNGTGDIGGGLHSTGTYTLLVNALATDPDSTLAHANALGAITSTATSVSASITPDIDIDIYSVIVTAGQVVDFNINTTLNGPGGLGSYLRLFNAAGQQLAFNNDAAAPGETTVGFDAYLRNTFPTAGTYYVGVSNYTNIQYNATSGAGTTAGGIYSIGDYTLVVSSPAVAPPDTDNTFTKATSLGAMTATPVSSTSAIDPDTDIDMYRFTVTAGQVVDFNINTPLNGSGGLGSYIRLFSSAGTELAYNNDANAPGENVIGFDAYLRHAFATSGTYYLGVTNYTNIAYNPTTGSGTISGGQHSTGTYTLVVNALPVDSDSTLAHANVLGAISSTPTTVTASITPDIDVDMYSVNVTAGQIVDFNINTALNGPGGLGSYLRLFNATGQQLAFNNDAAAPGETTVGFDAYLRYTFATTGTYYLGVSNYTNIQYNATTGAGTTAGGFHSIGAYTLIVGSPIVAPPDTDNTFAKANSLGAISTTAVSVTSTIDPDTDIDMYSFTASAGQVVDFNINTPLNGAGGLGSYIRLFSSAGTELAFNNDANAPGENVIGFDAYLRYTFATSGTYYLGVTNFTNIAYNPISGSGTIVGGLHSTGTYTLVVNALPIDPDATLAHANALGTITSNPTSVSASITPDVDVDMYSVNVTAGQVVDFNINTPLNGPGGLGSYLRLFNSSGQQLAFNNDAAAPGETKVGFDAYLRYTFATTGTYYLGVSNFTNIQYNANTGTGTTAGGFHSIGDYSLIVSSLAVTPTDPDDTLVKATELGAISTTPVSQTSTIDPDTDVDMYSFTVSAGQVVDFDINTPLNGAGGLGSYIRLFSSAGTELAFNNDANAPGENVIGFDAYLRYTFAASGTYYVGVSNYTNIAYNPITGSGDIAGGLHSTGTYSLIVNALPVDPDATLAHANALGAITSTPTSVSASIAPDIDVDMYSISVTAGQVVDFDIDTPLNGPGSLGSYLRLFNAAGQQLAFNNDAAAPGETTVGFDAYLRYTFPAAGTYYVGVSNYTNIQYNANSGASTTVGGFYSIGVYTLVFSTPAVAPPDPDNTFATANSLGAISSTPVSTTSAIDPDADIDMYRFTVIAGQVVDFNINTPLNGPGGLGSYIRLFSSAGTELAFNNDANAPGENVVGFDAYLRYAFATSGTYYLGVTNYTNIAYNPITGSGSASGGQNSTGTYSLVINALNPDPDATLAHANVLGTITSTATTVSASITPDIDVDMYSVNVTAGQVVDFNINTPLNGPGSLGSYLRLFNSAGQQLAFNNDAAAPGETAVGFDAYLRYTFSTAGTYYIGVSNFTNIQYNPTAGTGMTAGGFYSVGEYTLIVSTPAETPIDSDNTFAKANSLGTISTTAVSVASTIDPDVDVDMYSFTVTAGQSIDFNIDTTLNGPGGLGSYIRLFSATGTELAFNNDANAPGENVIGFDAYLRYAFATSGVYYLGVSNYTNIAYNPTTGSGSIAGGQHSTGTYSLIISALPVDPDATLAHANILGAVASSPIAISASITPDVDIDMYSVNVMAGQAVDFNINTPQNGQGGLGSYLRLFNATGQQLAFNNDAAAPGETTVGFDAYLRYTFSAAGTYYIGVSNSNNIQYSATSGANTTAGGFYSIGAYTLTVQAVTSGTSETTLALSASATTIPESNGVATGMVSRSSQDISQNLIVSLSNSNPTYVSLPTSVVILANQYSATFSIKAIDNHVVDGSHVATIVATAGNAVPASLQIQITDSNSPWYNAKAPLDVNDNGLISPIDALLVIDYLNSGNREVTNAPAPPYLDINSDNIVGPTDALLVINYLNSRNAGGGEGEQANLIAWDQLSIQDFEPSDRLRRARLSAIDACFGQF